MAKDQAYFEAEKKIQQALQSSATELDLSNMKLAELPESIGRLTRLIKLDFGGNSWNGEKNLLTQLPDSIWNLTQLQSLNLSSNPLSNVPESIGQLTQLQTLNISDNQLTALPTSLGQLTQLTELNLSHNQLTALPELLGQLTQLTKLDISNNQLTSLPESLGKLTLLTELKLSGNQMTALPESFGQLTQLKTLDLQNNRLASLPISLTQLKDLLSLFINGNGMKSLPEWLQQLSNLEGLFIDNPIKEIPVWIQDFKKLKILAVADSGILVVPEWLGTIPTLEIIYLRANHISNLPLSILRLEHLRELDLSGNPLNPALQSAYKQGLDAVKAYLRSLAENAEPLYEAKLVLVGEGNVGKTTLLKALKGKEGAPPQEHEPTTHGVEIDIHGLRLPHPAKDGVEIKLNAWDFGGQDVYRVTHQFFFSRRSLYLLVWEPRRGVQPCQVEDWLNMIRLRVGEETRVLIVATHCKTGERIARIDKSVFKQQYGDMIVGFHEVDSLVRDESTGAMTGIAELKKLIAEHAAGLEQMGMGFNRDWKAARDKLIAHPEPRISYMRFGEICAAHGLSPIDTDTLAHLMHDLGYIVHYGDDESLRDDLVLKPEWLTKAIGFVLEDRATAESEGMLPDQRLYQVWHDHPFEKEPRYDPELYPFFLRLMEKYDVSYRLPEDRHASLVAQHVPQVRPELPWLPEQNPPTDLRRIAMICAMEEDPPGLVPWMIVRTHDYAVEQNHHRLHWQKGVFLSHSPHGEAMLEKRGREFHLYAQAEWPEYFMNVLQHTLHKLITDKWPGLEGRYRFMVPCPKMVNSQPCKGRFNIHTLRQFLAEGDTAIRCQDCAKRLSIAELLFGFEERPVDVQLREIKEQLTGLDSRIANYFMALMHAIADEAKNGPRLFTLKGADARWSPQQLFSRPMALQLWCEAEGCQHPVTEKGKGVYQIKQTGQWVTRIAPYANFVLGVLKTVAPMAGPAINVFFGARTTEAWCIKDQLDLTKAILDKLPKEIKTYDRGALQRDLLSEPERSGILALHALLKELDPEQAKLGLHRVSTYTGDFRWLCKEHYAAWQPYIPEVIQPHD